MANTTWANIVTDLKQIRSDLTEQNFWIDVSFKIFRNLKKHTAHRSDLNLAAIATYWGYEIYQRYVLNNFPLRIDAVFFDFDYYSHLNLMEIRKEIDISGDKVYIVDLIADSTDVKEGEDLDEWLETDSFFAETLRDLWNDQLLDIWQKEGLLVTRKKKDLDLEHYWNYEDYIFMMQIWDYELNKIVIFLLGTYADYPEVK